MSEEAEEGTVSAPLALAPVKAKRRATPAERRGLALGLPTRLLRRADYLRLDAVGYDVIIAYIEKGASLAAIGKQHDVGMPNLLLWLQRGATQAFLAELEPDHLLELIACGHTIASIAKENGLSALLIERWAVEKCTAVAIQQAANLAAEARIDDDRQAMLKASSDLKLRKVIASHQVNRFHAERTTKRFSVEKGVRTQGSSGAANVVFNVSFHMSAERAQGRVIDADMAPAIPAWIDDNT